MNYTKLTDLEIRDLIINGNEEAVLYLIHDRYAKDIRNKAMSIYKTLYYIDDLNQILYMHLKGNNADWQTLMTFKNKSSFKTWFIYSVVTNLFLEKRELLIGSDKFHNLIKETDSDNQIPDTVSDQEKEKLTMVLEAIGRLKNDEYRLILIKELEGYKHDEIAKMIAEKRKKENKVATYRNELVIPNAQYIDMIKARAVKEVKIIVKQIEKEWYEN